MTDGPSLEMITFAVTAGVALMAALFVVFHRNPVVNAVALVINLACIAVFFLLLHAPFLAVIQVIVYAGAIMVLFLFVIMLLDLRVEMTRQRGGMFQRWMGIASAGLVFGLLLVALRRSEAFTLEVPRIPGFGTTEEVARNLFTLHLLPFELASVLLLVAMVGALMLAGRR